MSRGAVRAFVSYHDRQPDSDVAFAIEQRFEACGFEVWSMRQEKSAGRPWLDVYEDALTDSQVFLAVASAPYLMSSHCQNEIRLARKRQIEHTILVYPFIIEALGPVLDDEAERARRRLSDMGGFAKSTLPDHRDIERAAESLLTQLQRLGWATSTDSAATGPSLPLTVKAAASADDLFLILDESAPSAAVVRRVLVAERGARPSGRGRWTIQRELYEKVLVPQLVQAVGGS